MASHLSQFMPRLLTVEEFLQIDFGPDLKAELDNGYIRMMAGATREHSVIQSNLIGFLREKLRGSGCRPFGSDMGVRPPGLSFRYPDVSVDCGSPADRPDDLALSDPRVVIEILSPSTREYDLRVKRAEYREVASLDTIVMVDPEPQTVSVSQRIEGGWTETLFAVADVALPSLQLTIPHAEIFATD